MLIKSILVPLGNSEIGRSSLVTAHLVAQMFEAHLDVLHVRPDPRNMIPYVGEGMSGALIEEVMGAADREAGARAVSAHQMFTEFVRTHSIEVTNQPRGGVSASWREDAGREDEAVATYGRLVDLVTVSRPLKGSEVPTSTLFEAALFESGQPLLVAPPTPPASLGKRIMIAWNGSAEAARAISAGLPLLERAESVTLVSATGWIDGPTSIDGVARRLAWHGIDPAVRTLNGFSGSIGEAIIAEASTIGADMIVMGAYTQSRIRQMILGGVTRHVLSAANIPLIMAH